MLTFLVKSGQNDISVLVKGDSDFQFLLKCGSDDSGPGKK